jgi:hypothetical protein
VGLRDKLKRLERASRSEMIEVRQHDGTTARFPHSAAADALLALTRGDDHPLAIAARNSPDPEWTNSFYSAEPMDPDAEDLSERYPPL